MTSQAKLKSATHRSDGKRQAVLAAAEAVFLREGFAGASMDEIAEKAGVSKQTVYSHFQTKQNLFAEAVARVLVGLSARPQEIVPEVVAAHDLRDRLADYAERELTVALEAKTVQLWRLVIGEVARFPELAAALNERGPQRMISALTREIGRLVRLGLIEADDPRAAAIDFTWLVVGEPINRAMMLGDEAIPSPRSIRAHAEHVAQMFLDAHARGRGR